MNEARDAGRSWDVIVVGAGSAGCVVAARLTEDPHVRLLLLEAGPDFPSPSTWPWPITHGTHLDAAGYTTAFAAQYVDGQRAGSVVRGRVVGGSGAVNGCMFFRGAPDDYDSWGAEPWRYSEVERFFRRSESDLDYPNSPIHGSDGPILVRRPPRSTWLPHQRAFHEAALGLGFAEHADLADASAEGVGAIPINHVGGRRISAAVGYIDPVRTRPNLTVWGDTTAVRLRIDGRRAVGVLVDRGGTAVEVAADRLVLAAGGLGTPHLLMRSGVGPAPALRRLGIPVVRELPGVGQNVHDHPLLCVDVAVPDEFRPRAGDPDYQTLLVCSSGIGAAGRDVHVFPAFVEETLRYHAVLALPASSGELEFVSPDPAVPPRIRFRYLSDPTDRARLRGAVRTILDLVEQPALARMGGVRVEPGREELASDEALDAWIARSLESTYHTCGTCRMGSPGDDMAVVDARGTIHGLANVTVADLSIAPNVVRAPTNATAVMIGERIADLMVRHE
jgi:choline dehydrogenase